MKKSKQALFADDMILDIEKPQIAVRKLLELINELVKLQDTKLISRNLLHFYTVTINYHKKIKESNLPSRQKG